jgi:hypothetical protein
MFYRPFIVWSLIINMVLSFIKFEIITILIIKLLLIFSLWHFLSETHAKRKLIFYKKLGVSMIKLFSLVFVIDAVFSLPFLVILKEFV